MKTRKKEYLHLAGRSWMGMARSSLWQGPDHLLRISNFGYSEEYKRFYFKDVQAIIIQKTARGDLWSVVLGLLLVSAFMIGFLAIRGVGGLIFALCLGVPVGILMIVNIAKGSSCICRIRTAVQTETIETLSRLHKAREVVARLNPVITQAQGGFTEQDLAAIRELAAVPIAAAPAPEAALEQTTGDVSLEPATAAPEPAGTREVKTPWCALAFGMLILDGIFTGLEFVMHNTPLLVLNLLSGIAVWVVIIIALARLPHVNAVTRLRVALAGALCSFVAFVLFMNFLTALNVFHNQEAGNSIVGHLRWRAEHSIFESPMEMISHGVALMVDWGVGLYGFWQLSLLEARRKAPAAQPPALAPTAGAASECQEP